MTVRELIAELTRLTDWTEDGLDIQVYAWVATPTMSSFRKIDKATRAEDKDGQFILITPEPETHRSGR